MNEVKDNINPILHKIWEERFRKGEEKTKSDNYKRVAQAIANTPEEEEEFFSVMEQELFFTAGRTMSNAGLGEALTMNNCFVAPRIKDNLIDIFDKVKLGALTHQRGGKLFCHL